MKKAIEFLGNGSGILGVALCLVSGIARVVGLHYLAGLELMTLYLGGLGLMIGACLAKIHVLGTSHS